MVSSESDGTTRNNVPDWLIHFDVTWVDDSGELHRRTEDEYFLLLLNWLRQNYPQRAREIMEELAFKIARAKYGVDAEMIG